MYIERAIVFIEDDSRLGQRLLVLVHKLHCFQQRLCNFRRSPTPFTFYVHILLSGCQFLRLIPNFL